MTPKQKIVLEYLHKQIRQYGYAPSYEAIAAHIGVKARSNVGKFIGLLEQQGLVERDPSVRRSIKLTNKGLALVGEHKGCCPTCGQSLPMEQAA